MVVLAELNQAKDRLEKWGKRPKAMITVALDPRWISTHNPSVCALALGDESLVVDARTLPALIPILNKCPLVAYQAKNVYQRLRDLHHFDAERLVDPELVERVLRSGPMQQVSQQDLGESYLGKALSDANDGIDALAQQAKELAAVVQKQGQAVINERLVHVSRIESRALPAIADMETKGMALNEAAWRALNQNNIKRQSELGQDIANILNVPLQTDIQGQTFAALNDDTTLRQSLVHAGYQVKSLRKQVLKELPEPLGPMLCEYRELQKRTTAYGIKYLENIHDDGRIRPTFEALGANTGRMACHSPNVQAMVGDEAYRRCFSPKAQRTLVVADYATCELRILAHLSQDPVFLEIFARGVDLHASVASTIFKVPVSKESHPELRHRAKAINFGLVYGMSSHGLARTLKIPNSEAEGLLSNYFRAFPAVREFLNYLRDEGLRQGEARTITGRRLFLNPQEEGSSRVAMNMPIQGSSADITKTALAQIHKELRQDLPSAHIVNVIHDEFVVECDLQDADEVAQRTKQAMESAAASWVSSVPMTADVAIKPYWSK